MLFEKIRRTQKPVFITLALMFGLGFVFLGVGSGAGGLNPLDFLNNNSSSSVGNISDLNDQVRGNPKDAAAWLKLAEAYEAKGETEPALGAYQQYIGLRPKDTGTLITAAQLYEQDARTVQQQSSTSQSELSTLQSASTAGVSGVK